MNISIPLPHILSSCIHTELRLQDNRREYEHQAKSKNDNKKSTHRPVRLRILRNLFSVFGKGAKCAVTLSFHPSLSRKEPCIFTSLDFSYLAPRESISHAWTILRNRLWLVAILKRFNSNMRWWPSTYK